MSALCSVWATEDDLCNTPDEYVPMDEHFQSASELLYQLSGQQFPGICETTVRPCSRRCGLEAWYRPAYRYGQTAGLPWPGCFCDNSTSWCSCKHIHQIELGTYPIVEILEVLVDGDVVDPADYRLDASRYLVRLPDDTGFNPGWPLCQDLNLDSTEEGTFQVEFSYGRNPPTLGIRAAATLAWEFYLSCNPDSGAGACRLPRNISAITRQGVSVLFERLTRSSGPFRFGIWEVDAFLEAYAPYGPHPASVIMTPDDLNIARRVGT